MWPSQNTSWRKSASPSFPAPAFTALPATALPRSALLSARKRRLSPPRKNASPNSSCRSAPQLPTSSFQFLFPNFSEQNESQDKQNRYIQGGNSRSRFVILVKIEEDSDEREHRGHQGADEEWLD